MITLALYRLVLRLLAPLIAVHLARRARRGKEIAARLGERRGLSALARPPGPLIWCHAASVGETLSVLPLLERLSARGTILLTTGTVTSADLARRRLPDGAIHQFAPLDHPDWVARFLDHWRPDLGVFVEAEFWPNLILAAAARGPLALVNGRFSEASARGWARAPGLLRHILGAFDQLLAQDAASAARLARAAGRPVACPGNLKFDAPPLPDAPAARQALDGQIGARPRWLAASAQPGEEALIAEAVIGLGRDHPDLLTLVVPRHPERGPEVAALFAQRGLCVARRGAGEGITDRTQVYVADTLGELGLFYRLAPIAFVGGSLVPHGGQNPLEAARLGAAVVTGPHHWNQAEAVAAIGAVVVADPLTLAARIGAWLARPDERARDAAAQGAAVAALGGALDAVLASLDPLLPAPRPAEGGAHA